VVNKKLVIAALRAAGKGGVRRFGSQQVTAAHANGAAAQRHRAAQASSRIK